MAKAVKTKEQLTDETCFRCGSKLILITRDVEQTQGSQSEITTSVYRCSNQTCQDEIDKKTAEMKARRAAQEQQEIAKALKLAEAKSAKLAEQAAANQAK